MLVSTTDFIPDRKYEIIGLVTGVRFMSFLAKTELSKAIDKLIEEAQSMHADAIVGLRPYTTPNGSTGVIGTAVKFID